MMKSSLRFACLAIILSIFALSEAFQPCISVNRIGNTKTHSFSLGTKQRATELHLKAPKKAPETEKEQIGSENIKMLGAYLNPTRNPNSKHLVRLSGFL